MVLGDKESVLYGKGFITDTLCGLDFKISAKSFYQINSVQTEKLYNKALEYAQLTGKEKVIDAYCGIGTIGLIAAKNAKEVIGIELNKDAVRDAINKRQAKWYKKMPDSTKVMQVPLWLTWQGVVKRLTWSLWIRRVLAVMKPSCQVWSSLSQRGLYMFRVIQKHRQETLNIFLKMAIRSKKFSL